MSLWWQNIPSVWLSWTVSIPKWVSIFWNAACAPSDAKLLEGGVLTFCMGIELVSRNSMLTCVPIHRRIRYTFTKLHQRQIWHAYYDKIWILDIFIQCHGSERNHELNQSWHVDGLMQDYGNFCALTTELLWSCAKASITKLKHKEYIGLIFYQTLWKFISSRWITMRFQQNCGHFRLSMLTFGKQSHQTLHWHT